MSNENIILIEHLKEEYEELGGDIDYIIANIAMTKNADDNYKIELLKKEICKLKSQ